MNGTRTNTSLSMLGSMDSGPRAAFKEGNTIATEDSMTRNQNSMSSLSATNQKSRRGAKKETSRGMLEPADDNQGGMENSLSDLFSVSSGDYLFTSGDNNNREGATVSTMDSLARKESFNASQKLSRRGGKKNDNSSATLFDKPKKSDMEKSLSDLLIDDDADEDDDRHGSRESLTIVTKDSLQKAKEDTAPGSSRTTSKRGGRKVARSYSKEDLSSSLGLRGGHSSTPAPPPSLSATLGKLGGPPRDFGRQADDNDTFCGLGTVGEKELARGSPNKNAASPTKTKITMAPTRSKAIGKAAPSPFSRSSNDDDSDSEDEDLFQGFSGASNNPFRMPAHL
jgi:hypothetical protein